MPGPFLGRGTFMPHQLNSLPVAQLNSVHSARFPAAYQPPSILNRSPDRNRFTVSGSDVSSIASESDPLSDISNVPSPHLVRRITYRSSTRINQDSDALSAAASPSKLHLRRSSALQKRPTGTRKSSSVLPSKRKRSSIPKVSNASVSAADLKEAWRKEFKLKGTNWQSWREG